MDFNATGHPGVTVPMGLDPSGVPMGFQIVAPRFRDGLALGLAAVIEEARPWATTAPGYDAWPVY
jgi:Asp-tRNA(Asn)/Glu-tRNA(Gln) amidotransferase A subunit family amidase